jgi:predicted ATPase
MHATGDTPQAPPSVTGGSSPQPEHTSPSARDEERAVPTNRDSHAASSSSGTVEQNESRTQGKNFLSVIKQTLGTASISSTRNERPAQKEVHLEALVKSYRESNVAKEVRHEIDHAATANGVNNGTATPRGADGGAMRDVAEESTVLRGRRRASWVTQFRILSGRAFKNLYRNPALLAAHYTAAIAIAGE